jgi:hypothetical protein
MAAGRGYRHRRHRSRRASKLLSHVAAPRSYQAPVGAQSATRRTTALAVVSAGLARLFGLSSVSRWFHPL